jgi:hypothetical protein
MEQLVCNLCGGSPEIELYSIELSEKQRELLGKNYDTLKVDLCIGKEIESLINSGIKTRGCCCGHGKYSPSCLISKSEKEKLDKLGYKYNTYNNNKNLYEIELKTDVQTELRKVLSDKVFRYLEKEY